MQINENKVFESLLKQYKLPDSFPRCQQSAKNPFFRNRSRIDLTAAFTPTTFVKGQVPTPQLVPIGMLSISAAFGISLMPLA